MDPRLSQCHALVGVRHRQPVHALGFQKATQHHGVGAVAQSFDDGNHARGAHMSFEQPDVVDQVARVHRQRRDVPGRRQGVHHGLEPVIRRHLDEHVGAVEGLGQLDKRGKVMQTMRIHALGFHGRNEGVPFGVAPTRRPKPKGI